MPIESLKKLPKKAFNMWESTYKAARNKYSDSRAAKIAWAAVKKKFKKVEGKWVARSSDFEVITTVHYEFQADEASISRSEDGFSYVDYVLLTDGFHRDGIRFGPMAINSLIDQINEEGLVGRVDGDHSEWKRLVAKMSPEEIEAYLQSQDTGIKAVKAVKKKGKIVAKIKVKQDMVDKVLSMKGASVEARFPSSSFREGVVTQARYQGFVFTPKPADPKALRVGISG